MSDGRNYDLSWLAFNNKFDRNAHISLCAMQLEAMRTALGEKWAGLGNRSVRAEGMAEAKSLVKHIIRVASESVDFYATVDFLTESSYRHLESMKNAHRQKISLVGHLQCWNLLTHEHMVPGSEVLRAIASSPLPVQAILEALSFRALVSGSKKKNGMDPASDVYKLDTESKLKSKLPPLSDTTLYARGFRNIDQVPLQLRALMRYDAAGLLGQLIPVNTRASALVNAYEMAELK